MKRFGLCLVLLGVCLGVFGQDYCTGTEYEFIQWVKGYYNALEEPDQRKTAYDYFKRNVSFETYNEWYEDTDIFTLTNFRIEKLETIPVGSREYYLDKELDIFGPGHGMMPAEKYVDVGIIHFLVIHKEIIDGKVKRSFYEVTFDNYSCITKSMVEGGLGYSGIEQQLREYKEMYMETEYIFKFPVYDFGTPKSTSRKVEQPISDEEITLLEYYRYMEKQKNIEKAYEMSKKSVSLEKYKSWYPYEWADIDIIIKNRQDNLFSIELFFIEHYPFGKTEQSSFSVDIKTDDKRVLWSQSVPLFEKNMALIDEFCTYLLNGEYDNANSLLTKKATEKKLSNFFYVMARQPGQDTDALYNLRFESSFKNRYEFSAPFKIGVIFNIENDKITEYHSFPTSMVGGKPVIYLYPEEKQDCFVNITTDLEFIITIPEINDGWNVTAYPDSRIVNKADNTEYPYLFWEAYYENMRMSDKGFVVKTEELPAFFDEKLAFLGLNGKEIADFKEFWLEQLNRYPYYFITFADQREIDRVFELTVEPKPDSVIRVFFDHQGLETYKYVEPQQLVPRTRHGFAVVEWGGKLK